MYEHLDIQEGVLAVIAIEHDSLSSAVPANREGTDGGHYAEGLNFVLYLPTSCMRAWGEARWCDWFARCQEGLDHILPKIILRTSANRLLWAGGCPMVVGAELTAVVASR